MRRFAPGEDVIFQFRFTRNGQGITDPDILSHITVEDVFLNGVSLGPFTIPDTLSFVSTLGFGVFEVTLDGTKALSEGYYTAIATTDAANADLTEAIADAEVAFDAILHRGQAAGGGENTITLASTASITPDLYTGSVISLVSGTGAGQARTIAAYDGVTKTVTVDRPFVVNPDAATRYAIHGVAPKLASGLRLDVNLTQVNGDAGTVSLLENLVGNPAAAVSVDDAIQTKVS